MIQSLLRKDVLVKLPEYTEETTRKTGSGLYISALQEAQRYAPTHGEVLVTSERCKYIQKGDIVFFGNHLWKNSLDRAFGSNDERFKKAYFAHETLAIKEEDGYYMILPEKYVLFIKRGDEIIPINDYVIGVPIDKGTVEESVEVGGVNTKVNGYKSGSLLLVDLGEEKYRVNMAKIFAAPSDSDLKNGDLVHTLKHCDIFVENDLNNPILPDKYFFIELDDIVARHDL